MHACVSQSNGSTRTLKKAGASFFLFFPDGPFFLFFPACQLLIVKSIRKFIQNLNYVKTGGIFDLRTLYQMKAQNLL